MIECSFRAFDLGSTSGTESGNATKLAHHHTDVITTIFGGQIVTEGRESWLQLVNNSLELRD